MGRLTRLVFLFVLFIPSVQGLAAVECPKNLKVEWTNCTGTYVFDDGDKYEGEWVADKFHGQGTYFFADGDQYVGQWVHGDINGHGTYLYANGEKYVGEFRDGLSHGQGTHYYNSGDKYVGKWNSDKRHGQGVLYLDDGKVIKGIWDEGELIQETSDLVDPVEPNQIDPNSFIGQLLSPLEDAMAPLSDQMQNVLDPIANQMDNTVGNINSSRLANCPRDTSVLWSNCTGTYVFDDGDKYEGEWINDKFGGQGTYYFADGRIIDGTWENGELIKSGNSNNVSNTGSNHTQDITNTEFSHQDFGLAELNLTPRPDETEIDYNLRLCLVSFLRSQYFMSKALGIDERIALIQNTISGLERGDLGADSDMNKVVELSSNLQDEIDAKIEEQVQLTDAQRAEFAQALPNYFHGLYRLYQLVQSSVGLAQQAGDLVQGNFLNAFGVLAQAVTVIGTLPTLLSRFQGSSSAIIQYATSNGIDTTKVEETASGLF